MSSLPRKTVLPSYPCAHVIQALLFQTYFPPSEPPLPYRARTILQIINKAANLFGDTPFCERQAPSLLSAHISLAKASTEERAAFALFLEEFAATLVSLVKKYSRGEIPLDLPCLPH